ncbi:hypothetical protein E2C01_097981 [Portunus trituberculatus]|uniref:Uncharacterized protein n=1 Tax=Portunus trituberculatus TaxID=210409 RepID=A0A5B7JWK6_PORTR|nr:hypothetical protein [Portunus trituberculatus]
MNMEKRHSTEGVKRQVANVQRYFNPFSTGTYFYLRFVHH